MKKLCVRLLMILMLQACVLTVQAQELALGFEIDSVATAKAPWKEGHVIANVACPLGGEGCFRAFLGVTTHGQKIVQEFYSDMQTKSTDPFLVDGDMSWDELCEMDMGVNLLPEALEGKMVVWYPNGTKYMDIIKNGQKEYQIVMWDEAGKKRGEVQVVGDRAHFMQWDKEGNLTRDENVDWP